MGALEHVDTYGEDEYAIVRESPINNPGQPPRYLVCDFRLDDDDVQRPDVRYPIDDWPTEEEAWAFACGLSRGASENQ